MHKTRGQPWGWGGGEGLKKSQKLPKWFVHTILNQKGAKKYGVTTGSFSEMQNLATF